MCRQKVFRNNGQSIIPNGGHLVMRRGEDTLRCSFCGKSQNEVKKLIAGPTVYICNECIDICIEIISDDAQQEAAAARPPLPKTTEIKDFLDEYLIGQDNP